MKVSLNEVYGQNIVVQGYIYDEGSYNTNNPFTLTILTGNLSEQTAVNFYQTCAACTADFTITSVSPCPPRGSLAEELQSDNNFQALITSCNSILEMPSIDSFVANFTFYYDFEDLNAYMSNLSGISYNDMEDFHQSIINNSGNVLSNFPDLAELSDEDRQSVISQAVDIYFETQQNSPGDFSKGLNPCTDCKKAGIKDMTMGIISGAASGAYIGTLILPGWGTVWGGLAGAVVGFWAGAQQALACVKQYCH